MPGDATEAAAGYTAGLFGPFTAKWVIGPTTDGWKAVRRAGAGKPMMVVRDTARDLANRLAEEELAEELRAAVQRPGASDQAEA